MSENKEPQLTEQQKRFIVLCKSVFADYTDGKELLELLRSMIMAPVAPHNKESSYAYYREGENNMVRRFIRAIEMHGELAKGGSL